MRLVVTIVAIAVAAACASAARAAFPGQNGTIAFVNEGAAKPGVYTVNPDGTGRKRVVATATPNVFDPQGSPDGTQIVYGAIGACCDSVFRVVAADGSGGRVVVQGDWGPSASWTADGRLSWIELTTVLGSSLGRCVVVEGESAARFCIAPPAGAAQGDLRSWGRWSSQGQYAWLASRLPVSGTEIADQLALVTGAATAWNAGDPGAELLLGSPGNGQPFDWSPDGSKLVFSTAAGLVVVNADGTGEHVLGVKGDEPAWSPDGRKIVFGDGKGIAVVNADGSHLVQVTDDRDDAFPDWQPAATAYTPPASAKPAKPTAKKRKGRKP